MAKGPRPLIAGNWKMNGRVRSAVREIQSLATRLGRLGRAPAFDLLICPPATLIVPLRDEIKRLEMTRRIALGGQDCHAAEGGAHTGDIGARMLKDAGCCYAIVGHSERRSDHGEFDARVRAKAEAAQAAGLTAIICIGEVRQEREARQTLRVLTGQLAGSVPRGATARNTVIAYEPVWAIGTGLTPSPEDVAAAHAHIRERLAARFNDADKIRLLYGGSVKAGNATELLAVANVDGALVGGASLKAADFWPIALAVQPA